MSKVYWFLLFLSVNVSAQQVFTVRENNYVREGPAAYYQVVEILPAGSKISVMVKQGNWLKISLSKGKSGWLAANCVAASKKDKSGLEDKLITTWTSDKASRTGIAAAIKGLNQRSKKTIAGDVDKLLRLTSVDFSPAEYLEFIQPLQKNASSNIQRGSFRDLDLEDPVYDPGFSEMQIGMAVASRLAAGEVIEDKLFIRYSNKIAALLSSNFSFYEWDFRVVILNENEPDGYAVPAGYIFITKGALLLCSNEAEFAFVIAHEMAHIVRRHGLQEMTKRKVQITADKSFAELEETASVEISETESDLEDQIIDSYEAVYNKRLLGYETESDKIAAVLIAAAGYDPFASVTMVKKLTQVQQQKSERFGDVYPAGEDPLSRWREISKFTGGIFKTANPGATVKDRFKKMMAR